MATGYIKSIELYSPEGGCQYQLEDYPIDGAYLYWPAVAYIDGKIVACGGNNVSKECRVYDRFTDTWDQYCNTILSQNIMVDDGHSDQMARFLAN